MPDQIPEEQTSLTQILKMGDNVKLTLPKDLNKIQRTIESWERIMSLLNPQPNVEETLLRMAIDKRDLQTVINQLEDDDDYDTVKQKLLREVAQTDIQLILSPIKRDPIKAFKAIVKKFSQERIEDKIHHLKEHLDQDSIKQLIYNCDNDEQVLQRLKRMSREESLETSKHKKKKNTESDFSSDSKEDEDKIVSKLLKALKLKEEKPKDSKKDKLQQLIDCLKPPARMQTIYLIKAI